MTVPFFFALLGGIIVVGFLANLLFRLTKIPSVLLLIGIGVVLGPVTEIITSDLLVSIAPYIGTLALIIILFEGGLELDIVTVIKQAPRATLLTVLVFVFSVASVFAFAYFIDGFSVVNALLLAAVLGATSPAICIPVVSGLSVRDEIKTLLKLESALGDVLLIVTVVMILDFERTGVQEKSAMVVTFLKSFGVAFFISSVAGVLWSRLISWMGKENLSYMLTLGFMFLLYFVVEELHGSAAIAVLMFGLILANMEVAARRIGKKTQALFGIDIIAEKFVLDEFIKNITAEISFFVRTFFFVYLGLLLNFESLTLLTGISAVLIVLLLLGSRKVGIFVFKMRNRSMTPAELEVVMAMMPRGLATAVMAFLPLQAGIPGVESLPMYAFVAIVLTNIYMTFRIIIAERRLESERKQASLEMESSMYPDEETGEPL
ncbi:MAG: hypothetical protein GXO82_01310 [Chlorobi bacterium]|nr:hypothetical protein [Chlorobiota bacterium]